VTESKRSVDIRIRIGPVTQVNIGRGENCVQGIMSYTDPEFEMSG
jgi:hypothetical protein